MGQCPRSSLSASPCNSLPSSLTIINRTGVPEVVLYLTLFFLEMQMKIAVHRFQVWDAVSDTMKTSTRYATVDAIRDTAHGVAVPGTEILIDASELSSDIEGMTLKDYKPDSRPA